MKKYICAAICVSLLSGMAIPAFAQYNSASEAAAAVYNDKQNDVFQYHFAGGTDDFNNGISDSGKKYDTYLWVPNNIAPGELKGLVAIKANLIEVPFVESQKLRDALSEKGFGILWLVFQKDNARYNTTFSNFNTRLDYKGSTLYTDTDTINNNPVFTTDGKDAADIMNDILKGIAAKSGYSEIADKTPLITIGHSAASPFGYRSGNWNPDRIIAQVQMKNGMGGPIYQNTKGEVPGIPSLQYAAQYTEHALGADRDRSVRDARWHISNQRKDTNHLVSHIIEWGSGHYDWSANATDMMINYISKAIDYRLPDNYNETGKLNDLTSSGYLMKPFEKNSDGTEHEAGYYQNHLWLSSGENNSTASESDKQSSFWFFDKEFADDVNSFTSQLIPPSPDSKGTGIAGNTYSDIEPFMLMKNPSSASSDSNTITPFLSFNGGMSRYGNNRFVNYSNLTYPDSDKSNPANLGGYGDVTVDNYYMNKIPSKLSTAAYDGAGNDAFVPSNTEAVFMPLMAPYEVVSSNALDISGMTKSGDESENTAAASRTTLRFHNNRVYYRSGCAATNEFGSSQDSYGMIVSPEVSKNGIVTSGFKATGAQMNVPYVTNRSAQTLTLNTIPNINITDVNSSTTFGISYTSSDSDLQKYTDVFVEYGPAEAIRTVNDDGSYSWNIEILKDEIPKNASYPIEVSVVASNLGKWEKVNGASAQTSFYITDRDTKSGVELDGVSQDNYDAAMNNAKDGTPHNVTVYSDSETAVRHNFESNESISISNGDFASSVKQTSNNMMLLTITGSNPQITLGKTELSATDTKTALSFDMNNKSRFAELNSGTMNLYNGTVIKNGSAARGAGIDVKTGSSLYIHGGIITGNTAKATDNKPLGGGGISIVGSGKAIMDGGIITGNTSTDNCGGGVSVMEYGSFEMIGGTISGNIGYDVYVNNNNFKMSGSAYAGNVFLNGKTINVNAPFTTSGSHAEITPASYTEGTSIAVYADGVSPSTSDFTITPNGDESWYTYIDGQELKLTTQKPYTITSENVTVQKEASSGETVKVTLPSNYVPNSLVISGLNPSEFTKLSDNEYSFTMPSKDTTVSCLVNNDSSKEIIVGTPTSYYVKQDNPMDITFDVPSPADGYIYSSGDINVPVRAGGYNSSGMSAVMNDERYNISNGDISGTGTNIKEGINTLTLSSTNSIGVDYYSYSKTWNNTRYDYPTKAANLPTLTLTKTLYAQASKIVAENVSSAAVNSDAVGWYIENLPVYGSLNKLKWELTFTDGNAAQKAAELPSITGNCEVSFGIILHGHLGDYTTADIDRVNITE